MVKYGQHLFALMFYRKWRANYMLIDYEVSIRSSEEIRFSLGNETVISHNIALQQFAFQLCNDFVHIFDRRQRRQMQNLQVFQ